MVETFKLIPPCKALGKKIEEEEKSKNSQTIQKFIQYLFSISSNCFIHFLN
jgi:hypothetical protein